MADFLLLYDASGPRALKKIRICPRGHKLFKRANHHMPIKNCTIDARFSKFKQRESLHP